MALMTELISSSHPFLCWSKYIGIQRHSFVKKTRQKKNILWAPTQKCTTFVSAHVYRITVMNYETGCIRHWSDPHPSPPTNIFCINSLQRNQNIRIENVLIIT